MLHVDYRYRSMFSAAYKAEFRARFRSDDREQPAAALKLRGLLTHAHLLGIRARDRQFLLVRNRGQRSCTDISIRRQVA